MAVDAGADEESPSVVAPFVLQVAAVDVDTLGDVVVVAEGHIVKVVVVVFHPGYELSRHEPQAVEVMGPLCAGCHHEVVGAPVGVGVFFAAVVAFPFCVLGCGKDVKMVGTAF